MSNFYRFKVWKSSLRDTPERVECLRQTNCYYILPDGSRELKKSALYDYFATEQEALAAIERQNRARKELATRRRIESYGPELLGMLERAIRWMEEADIACFDHEAGPKDTYSEDAVITQAKELAAKVKGEQS